MSLSKCCQDAVRCTVGRFNDRMKDFKSEFGSLRRERKELKRALSLAFRGSTVISNFNEKPFISLNAAIDADHLKLVGPESCHAESYYAEVFADINADREIAVALLDMRRRSGPSGQPAGPQSPLNLAFRDDDESEPGSSGSSSPSSVSEDSD